MNYPFGEDNWLCRRIGHRYGRMYLAGDAVRQTCWLDGKTIPPFRQLSQVPPFGYLPDDQQPPGAV